MLYSIEIAQTFASDKMIKQESFYKSMLHSFEQAIRYMVENVILNEFKSRVKAINDETVNQKWINFFEFNTILDRLDY